MSDEKERLKIACKIVRAILDNHSVFGTFPTLCARLMKTLDIEHRTDVAKEIAGAGGEELFRILESTYSEIP
jgi:hypothetical protein